MPFDQLSLAKCAIGVGLASAASFCSSCANVLLKMKSSQEAMVEDALAKAAALESVQIVDNGQGINDTTKGDFSSQRSDTTRPRYESLVSLGWSSRRRRCGQKQTRCVFCTFPPQLVVVVAGDHAALRRRRSV